MDVAGELWPGMTANLGVTYAYTRYDEGVTIFGTPLGGEHFTNAPVWSGSLGATQEWSLAEGLIASLHGDYFYGSGRNTGSQQGPLKYQEGYGLLNFRGAVESEDGDWELALWCRNCLDEEYYSVLFDSVFQSSATNPNTEGYLGARREIALSVSRRW
jgi:hypothetical protein